MANKKLYSSSDARVNKRLRQIVENKRGESSMQKMFDETKQYYTQPVEKKISEKQSVANIFDINQSLYIKQKDWAEFCSIPSIRLWPGTK